MEEKLEKKTSIPLSPNQHNTALDLAYQSIVLMQNIHEIKYSLNSSLESIGNFTKTLLKEHPRAKEYVEELQKKELSTIKNKGRKLQIFEEK